MREIKFRAWDIQEKKMIFDPVEFAFRALCKPDVENRSSRHIGYNNQDYEHFHIMQYTGLTDKNGVEIYEGDIFYNGRVRAVVVWDDSGYWTANVIGDKKWVKENYTLITYGVSDILGNIHQNPDLLEV